MNFAHIVSHNLRSHSSNLSMLSGFLAQEKKEKERKNLVQMLQEASGSLNETVMHLNEVVQVKAHALEKMKAVNLYDCLKAVEKNISVLLKEKEAKCIISVPRKQNIKAIPAYLDSVFLNLFTNSLKYSFPSRKPVIEITSEEKGDKVVVKFKDNGLGIDLDRHGENLFGMYKTFHRHKDAKGIGLFITKNQIEAMNGNISVESTVDVGTTFTLVFDIN
ncbi:sensor histidine kinase [Maribacter halichondriae]|uniref:sensor histidine kinase n=1 Tax=Maribacter halichondriae TaxID=2980554 RepID=UPI00235A0584|nr:HAMP domain-containing sensor histidine kinase [Maribacter sp. Hal144]